MCVNELGNATFLILYQEPVNYTMSPDHFWFKKQGTSEDSEWFYMDCKSIWYYSEPSEIPCSSNQYVVRYFLGTRYDTLALVVTTYSKGL